MKKVLVAFTFLFLFTFLASYLYAREVRKWTSGEYTIQGEFVELTEDGIVRIHKTNGKFVRVPLEKLSEEEQEYVKQQATPSSDSVFEEENSEENGASDLTSGQPTAPQTSDLSGDNVSDGNSENRKMLTVKGVEYFFCWCPEGEFNMGSENGESDDEQPIHPVRLTQGFWLLETEVTQEMWESMMGVNPSQFKDPKNPVEKVSWNNCQEFCQRLSETLGQMVQLPTEAQWEYACRAGMADNHAGNLNEMAWYHQNSGSTPHNVGTKKPNAWGLYDMQGNVWEWCQDSYNKEYYKASPTDNPVCTDNNTIYVIRGGDWNGDSTDCRPANRGGNKPWLGNQIIGLRIVLNAPGPEDK